MGNQYLENELYCKLVHELSGHETYYLYSDYQGNAEALKNLKYKSEFFTEVVNVPCPKFQDSVRSVNGFFTWLSHCRSILRWRKRFLAEVERIDPDRVVVLNPFLVNFLVLSAYTSGYQTVYIQSCNTKRTYAKKMSLRGQIKSIFYARVLGVPVKSKESNPILAKGVSKFLFWSEFWVPSVTNGHLQAFPTDFTGYVLNDKLFDQFKQRVALKVKPKVLVCLNKEASMGMEAWLDYRDFYLRLFQENPEIDWLIKPHPLSSQKLINDSFSEFKLINSPDWDEIDIMINHWSSLTWTSLILGVPTMLVNPAGKYDLRGRFLDGYEFTLHQSEDFQRFIKQWKETKLDGFYKVRESFLEKSLYSTDNQSTRRTAHAILADLKL